MNNDSQFTTIGDEPVEARIVAWVLGEASAFEAAELERLCGERPELMIFKRRMAALHGLLAEAENPQADDAWKLPADKRKVVEDLLGGTKVVVLKTRSEKRIHGSGPRAFLAIAACVLFTLVITRLQPWKQTSEAIIEVKPRTVGMSPLGSEMGESSGLGRMTPQFFGTEFEKIKSRNSLEKVVENLDLANRWDMDKEQAVEKLKKSIKTEKIPDTGLIKIQVRNSDKKAADEITREVALAYKNYREQLDMQDADRQLVELNKAVRDQEDKVEERRKVLATIVRNKAIIYEGNDSFYGSNDTDESAIKRGLDAQDYVDAKREFETDQQLLQTMKLKQMGETIARKAPSESVVLHEVPESGARSAERASDALASYAPARTQRLETTLPKELIEGTPRPNNVPKLEAPADGPAGSGTWSANEESQLAYKSRARPEPPARPSAPVSSLTRAIAASTASASAVPVPEDVTAPSLDFGDSDDFGTDRGEDKEQNESLPDLTELMEEIAASEEPYSTFSLNISDASFRIAQAAMDQGERPDPAGVKVEQFYNAVDYGDPSPAAGEPVSCTIEQAVHPVIPGRNLVRVAMKTAAAGRSATQPLHLTLLVDQSGSMTRADRRAAMDAAMAGLGKLLTENDIINVVGFSRTSRLLADGMKGDEAGMKLAELVNQSASEGGTHLETAIDLAGQMAQRRILDGAQNRIVLFTDGAANLGDADPQRLAAKVGQLRQQGIAFDIAGIAADGLNDELLGELARKGNGRYYVVGKGAEENFAKQLAGAFRPAAENVKVQVRFNPERVARYRLIGFEKDRLKTEDFRNDKVDAAELAAEEAGVAIYQIELNPNGTGEIGEVSVRFLDTASGEMVERGWTIPHDASAPAIHRATPSMQLALLSMFAAEKLKGGPLGEAIDFNQLAEPQANVKHFFGHDTRVAEMLRMVEMLK